MPHIVDTLRTLLKGKADPSYGVVETVSGATARIRTSRGIVGYSTNGLILSPGQRVTLGATGITSISGSRSAVETYEV